MALNGTVTTALNGYGYLTAKKHVATLFRSRSIWHMQYYYANTFIYIIIILTVRQYMLSHNINCYDTKLTIQRYTKTF